MVSIAAVDGWHCPSGGVNAFSEYERGKTQASKSTVLLLKLLDKHPELLKEIGA